MAEETDLFSSLKDDYREALEHCNDALLRLENNPADGESLNTACRELHNIKGFANRTGAAKVGQLAHILEDVLTAVKEGRLQFDGSLADLLFQGMDIFVHYLRTREVPEERVAPLVEAIEPRLFSAFQGEAAREEMEGLLPDFIAAARDNVETINQGLFRLEKEPGNREVLQEVYRNAHSLKGSALTMGFERMGRLAHRMEDILRAFQKGELQVSQETCDALFEANDAIAVMLDTLAAGKRMKLDVQSSLERLASFLASQDTATAEEPFESRRADAEAAEPLQPAMVALDSVRVPTARLDELANLAGEAVIAQIRVASELNELLHLRERWQRLRLRQAGSLDEAGNGSRNALVRELLELGDRLEDTGRRLQEAVENSGRHIEALQHRTMEIRMLPLGLVFATLPRAVRDLSRQSGKRVDFQVRGEETTIDKRILEQIGDPLIHLLRNALDHGIETPDLRRQGGKPETGTILLQARQEGAKVIISLEDDGQGIDPEHLKEVALRKGLVDESQIADWSEAQLLDLIFVPGFSTAALVTDVSGRGVGLDVVRANVERLKGQVLVSSETGKWTRFDIILPLTLATVHALMVKCAGEVMAIPTYSVARTLHLAREEIKTIQGGLAIVCQEEILPVLGLVSALGWSESEAAWRSGERLLLVVLQAGERKVAFGVDEILGEQEIVTKDLGSHLRQVRFVAGATILGSGEVCLILDVAQLLWQEQPPLAEQLPVPEAEEPVARRRRLILVVEDQVVTRQMEKSILEAAGYEVVTAKNGLDALEKLEEQDFDLVVTDIQMPEMDGFTLTETIRQQAHTRNLPVVVVSSMESAEDKRRGLEVGADAYLVKSSFDQRHLIDTIETLLGER